MSGPKDRERPADAFAATVPGTPARRPDAAAGGDDVVTSAATTSIPPSPNATGSVALGGVRLSETSARELLSRRFARAGLSIQVDHTFRHGAALITLDGFDPERGVGYQFVSHADADVVTDFDDDAASVLAALSRRGVVHVFVVHDHQAPTADALAELADAFLAAHAPPTP